MNQSHLRIGEFETLSSENMIWLGKYLRSPSSAKCQSWVLSGSWLPNTSFASVLSSWVFVHVCRIRQESLLERLGWRSWPGSTRSCIRRRCPSPDRSLFARSSSTPILQRATLQPFRCDVVCKFTSYTDLKFWTLTLKVPVLLLHGNEVASIVTFLGVRIISGPPLCQCTGWHELHRWSHWIGALTHPRAPHRARTELDSWS